MIPSDLLQQSDEILRKSIEGRQNAIEMHRRDASKLQTEIDAIQAELDRRKPAATPTTTTRGEV